MKTLRTDGTSQAKPLPGPHSGDFSCCGQASTFLADCGSIARPGDSQSHGSACRLNARDESSSFAVSMRA